MKVSKRISGPAFAICTILALAIDLPASATGRMQVARDFLDSSIISHVEMILFKIVLEVTDPIGSIWPEKFESGTF